MKTTVTELPESRVKIDVAVEADDVEKRVDRAASEPRRRDEDARLSQGQGPAAARDPAGRPRGGGRAGASRRRCRSGTSAALLESGVTPVGDPKLDVGELPGEGEDLAFTIEVGVRPKAELGEYKGLEVGRAEIEVPEEAIEAELERLREGFGSLTPVERPAAAGRRRGDRLRGHDRRRAVRGLGVARLRDRARRRGAAARVRRRAHRRRRRRRAHGRGHLPRRPPAGGARRQDGDLRGRRSRRCARRTCPSSTTTSPPRHRSSRPSTSCATTSARVSPRCSSRRAEADFREAAVDAVAANATLEIPHELVHARAHEMWERVERQLTAQRDRPADLCPDAGQGPPRADRRRRGRRRAGAAPRGGARRGRRGGGDRADRRGPDRGARPRRGQERPEKLLARLRRAAATASCATRSGCGWPPT